MDDNDPSVIRNRHEDNPPYVPPPIVGEVLAGLVSIAKNEPETLPPPTPPTPLTGEVAFGCSDTNEVAPSLLGTSYDPTR
jgi:hypothetical protein